jgi:hypothetical protein
MTEALEQVGAELHSIFKIYSSMLLAVTGILRACFPAAPASQEEAACRRRTVKPSASVVEPLNAKC